LRTTAEFAIYVGAPFTPALGSGMLDTLNPGDGASETVTINAAE